MYILYEAYCQGKFRRKPEFTAFFGKNRQRGWCGTAKTRIFAYIRLNNNRNVCLKSLLGVLTEKLASFFEGRDFLWKPLSRHIQTPPPRFFSIHFCIYSVFVIQLKPFSRLPTPFAGLVLNTGKFGFALHGGEFVV